MVSNLWCDTNTHCNLSQRFNFAIVDPYGQELIIVKAQIPLAAVVSSSSGIVYWLSDMW